MRYYITDRKQGWWVSEAIAEGVEYIQIREKDLSVRDLLSLTRAVVEQARGTKTRILVNDRSDVALAAGAFGVHLRANAVAPSRLKELLPFVAVSCHTPDEVERAAGEGADLVVFGPIFATPHKGAAIGLEPLREAARRVRIPVFALGGVTRQNAAECLAAGAAGLAGIRLFSR